ncbi:hypothetical protein MNV49_007652 [Pseudohyphozyma bogoriensis]|nr:hypothetical protein MNV49_007652 [Pseudohyphozyma bogoriensis]
MFLYFSHYLLLSITLVCARVAAQGHPQAVRLSVGSFMKKGEITPTYIYQASGKLEKGGCPKSVGISDCYSLFLASSGMLETTVEKRFFVPPQPHDGFVLNNTLTEAARGPSSGRTTKRRLDLDERGDDGGRQRTEFQSSWKYHLKNTATTNSFFHLTQLLRRDSPGGPVIFLDAVDGQAQITDVVRGCSPCASIDLSRFVDRTTYHVMTVTYGSRGSFLYRVIEAGKSGRTLLEYSAKGDMGDNGSVKHGMYRELVPGVQSATAYTGGYKAKRLN